MKGLKKRPYLFIKALIFSGLLSGFFSGTLHASGYYISEQGVKAAGMGNAFTAIADDASAVWYNPAGLAFQQGINVTAGIDYLIPNNAFTDTVLPATGKTYTAKKQRFLMQHGYASYAPSASSLALGIGVNAPFGLSTDWTNSGAPFADMVPESITFSQIQMVNINPVLAYQLNERWAVAAGLANYRVQKINLNSHALNLNGKGDGWGGNVALLYKGSKANIGVSYRSRVQVDIRGTATGQTLLGALNGATSTASTSLTFPDVLNLGVAFHLSEQWLLSVEADWVNWKVFKSIELDFDATSPLGNTLIALKQTSIPENWQSSAIYRVGVQRTVNERLQARVGYVYDASPITDKDFMPRSPGNDRQLFSLGFSYAFSPVSTLDMAYDYVTLKARNQTASTTFAAGPPPSGTFYNGRYTSSAHLFLASWRYRW